MKKLIAVLSGLALLSACSSVIEGTTQEITVNSNPAGADCSLVRQGVSIGHVNPTPSSVTIKKTKYDITVVCNKFGYSESTFMNHSGAAGTTFGNIIFGAAGLIGWGIDSAAGADNKYETPVNITLLPVTVQHTSASTPATSPAAPTPPKKP